MSIYLCFFSEMDIMQQFQINQARAEAITLKEVFPISSGTEDVVDADNTFGDDEDIPDFMREFIATIGQVMHIYCTKYSDIIIV